MDSVSLATDSCSSSTLSYDTAPSFTPAASSQSQISLSKSIIDVCLSCGTSLTGWNNMRRSLHVAACKSRKPPESGVNACTLCHRIFTTKQGLSMHKKKCGQSAIASTSNNASNRQSTSSNASDGDFQRPSASARSVTSVPKTWEGDEEMQTAMALSRSIYDEAKRRESQIKLESKELPLPTSLTLTSTQKEDILASRVAAIISGGTLSTNSIPDTHENCTTQDSNVDTDEVDSQQLKMNSCNLWRSSFSCFDEADCYYVSALVPPLSPCKISVHEKLMTLTQVPGRDKSRWSQHNKLLSPLVEKDPTSQQDLFVQDSTAILSQGFILPSSESESHSFLLDSSMKTEESTMEAANEKFSEVLPLWQEVCSLEELKDMNEHQKKFLLMINNPLLSDVMIECKDHVFLHAHKFILMVNTSSLNLENVQSLDLTEYHQRIVARVLVGLYAGLSLSWSQEEEIVWTKLGISSPLSQDNAHPSIINDIQCDIVTEVSQPLSPDMHEMEVDRTLTTTPRHSAEDVMEFDEDNLPIEMKDIPAATTVVPLLSTSPDNSPTPTPNSVTTDVRCHQDGVHDASCDLFLSSQSFILPNSPVHSLTCPSDDDMFDPIVGENNNDNMMIRALMDEPFTPAPLSKRLKLMRFSPLDSPSTTKVNNSNEYEIFSQPSSMSAIPSPKCVKNAMWSPAAGILSISTPPPASLTSSTRCPPLLTRVAPLANQIVVTPPSIQDKAVKKKLRSPLTPMPLYESMMTPHLKKSLSQFGVRPLGKKKAIILLKEIYRYTHQDKLAALSGQVHTTETTCHKDKPISSCEADIDNPCSESDVDVGDDGERDFYACAGALEESLILIESENVEPEEDITSVSDTKQSVDTNKKNEPAEQQVLQFIRTNAAIYTNVLLYEPLELDYLHAEIKAAGIKIGLQRLMNVLDEQCITFTMRNRNQPGHNRHQRSKKRKAPQGIASQTSTTA